MLKTSITGETMIFKNDKGFYSTTISKKNKDGEYENAYIPVSFKKGVELENRDRINVTNGFLTFDSYTDKEGKTRTNLKIFVLDFEGGNKKASENDDIIFGAQSDDDLPF